MNARKWMLGIVLAAASAAGCTWETDLPQGAKDVHVEPSRELVVTDDALLTGLSHNDGRAPLGFARAASALPVGDGAMLRWLDGWSRRLAEEGHDDRARTFDARVTCRWLKAEPKNGCDDACGACAERALRPEAAPFRLVAIANRTDLSTMPDRKGDGGEGRLVFGLTDGPGDDPASAPLPMTVIFEYAQDGPALDWAKRWHALGDVPAAELAGALVALTDRFVAKGAIAQIRTADALTGPMLLHEFHVVSGEIVAANVRNSPAWGRVPPDALRSFAAQNADAIEQGTALLPSAWWASSSATADEAPSWVADVPAHDELIRQTCGGCHAQSDTGFQIDPRAKGTAKLSRFLSDPTKESDDIRRRVEWMQLEIFSAR